MGRNYGICFGCLLELLAKILIEISWCISFHCSKGLNLDFENVSRTAFIKFLPFNHLAINTLYQLHTIAYFVKRDNLHFSHVLGQFTLQPCLRRKLFRKMSSCKSKKVKLKFFEDHNLCLSKKEFFFRNLPVQKAWLDESWLVPVFKDGLGPYAPTPL